MEMPNIYLSEQQVIPVGHKQDPKNKKKLSLLFDVKDCQEMCGTIIEYLRRAIHSHKSTI